MADESRKLLRYIVRNLIARQEAVDIEADATAVDRGAEIEADQRRALREEEQRAEELSDAFRDGLLRAGAARRAGGNAISLDDRKDVDNRQADALIQFLVRADLASSTTRETERYRYIYTISVDWDALTRVAREAKVDLADVLGQQG
ncbi:MAG: hypothetical protein DCC58_01025 [Chloroflexi bacterium]|nr:MAG: hypothetical protein DCC58_01025 [Chloroflexota bacterium]